MINIAVSTINILSRNFL